MRSAVRRCIGCYAAAYYFLAPQTSMGANGAEMSHVEHLVNAVYFSVITFTTVGFGDILPKTPDLKLIYASEALFGCFTMGLVVAGFSNKSRY